MMRTMRTYFKMVYQTILVLYIDWSLIYSGRNAFLPPLNLRFILIVMNVAITNAAATPAHMYKAIGFFSSIQTPISLI